MVFFRKSIFWILIISFNVKAQYHEIGAFLGGSNYIGDIGNTMFVYPTNPVLGVVYKWNLTTRYSIRAGINISNLKNSDYDSNDLSRFSRAKKINTTINEGIAGIEFNFIDFNLHDGKSSISPYMFMGLGYFSFKPDSDSSDQNSTSIAIPVSVGLKINPNSLFVLGFEIGARYSLTDYLDGSYSLENELDQNFGNEGNNDWYVFTGLTISFTFGDLPCYCKEK
jgi:hypothetical protein